MDSTPNGIRPGLPHLYSLFSVQKRTLSKHRHATPSGPWPWTDLDDEIDPETQATIPKARHVCPHEKNNCEGCWTGYPQLFYPNWTPPQVQRCGISGVDPNPIGDCGIHYVDVDQMGHFSIPKSLEKNKDDEIFWRDIQKAVRPAETRVRCLFVEQLSLPILKMLGTKYDIEPFYWSSSINWIPARYQENLQQGEGDPDLNELDITITLAFPRAIVGEGKQSPPNVHEVIDTQLPLPLNRTTVSDDEMVRVLELDMLAIHMIRGVETSTIISHQPSFKSITSSKAVHSRVYLAGQSVYWNYIFRQSRDPTFILLTMLWYALYAWDQALEYLWEHISYLEINVVQNKDIAFTQGLHRARAYLLHYASLLDDFKNTVQFIRQTPNPALDVLSKRERDFSRKLLKKECQNLSLQIDRLQKSREMWDQRLSNIMQLGFSSVNIDDNKQMKELTKATVRDSAAMKQVAYLTMFFLPGTFIASAFGMNISIFVPMTKGTLAHYIITSVLLTSFTVWLIIALHGTWKDHKGEDIKDIKLRLVWPWILAKKAYLEWRAKRSLLRQESSKQVDNV
ncbi:hypothetical protein Clacol_002964 [Clathrus columnatus]|uniref:Uncharacterized protein n=1 Tax=Clathrus columnatus TaxID=1419009 RepID=A0AAV5A3B7_9AGAM|nr:hypothetical protein Clacol_002964 [Clathrus columnatus]